MAPPEKHSDRPGCQVKNTSRVRSNGKQVWRNLMLRGAKIFASYRKLPRFLQIGAIYSLIGLTAAGIFCWQLWFLKAAHPYIAENSPETLEDTEEIDPFQNITDRPVKGNIVLPEIEGDPEDTGLVAAENSQPVATSSDSPEKGLWPVSGELLYSYHDPVAQGLNLSSVKYCFSKGLAIKANSGTGVRAVWAGTVIRISERGYPYGQAVTMRHDNGLVLYYGALQEVVVEEGNHLLQGEQIGLLAGGSEGPSYLYLEIRQNQKTVDPRPYLP